MTAGMPWDCFFMAARTVHALGAGCLVYELQQTADITFRVYDWGRVGADGKSRPLHVREALATIDFGASGFGPRRPPWRAEGAGRARTLVDCAYFRLEEHELPAGSMTTAALDTCAAITCLAGEGTLSTGGGGVPLAAARAAVVPAVAGRFQVEARAPIHFVVATPRL